MSVELYNKIHELELRCKELKTERDSTKEAHRILNDWRNENLSKINKLDEIDRITLHAGCMVKTECVYCEIQKIIRGNK